YLNVTLLHEPYSAHCGRPLIVVSLMAFALIHSMTCLCPAFVNSSSRVIDGSRSCILIAGKAASRDRTNSSLTGGMALLSRFIEYTRPHDHVVQSLLPQEVL